MLKATLAAGALVAASLVAPAAFSAQPTVAQSAACTSSASAVCKWLTGTTKKCLYCKTKQGTWKKKYCQSISTQPSQKPAEPQKRRIICEGDIGKDTKPCITCKDADTGKVVQTNCKQ